MRLESLKFSGASFKAFKRADFSKSKNFSARFDDKNDSVCISKPHNDRKMPFGIDFSALFNLSAADAAPLGNNPRKTIINAVKAAKGKYKFGKDACVFELPDNPDMVLRIKHKTLKSLKELPKNLAVVPVKYRDEISDMQNLALPLYVVVEKDKIPFRTEYILPEDTVFEKGEILILKKAEGKHPSEGYFDSISELMGIRKDKVDEAQQANYLKFVNSAHLGDPIEFLISMRDGSASKAGLFNTKTFYKNYQTFTDDYLKTLSKIADMPQEAYDEAVSTILAAKELNFRPDFQHPLNTFVDFENNRFNFSDIEFDPKNFKYYDYNDPVAAFENVLLGYHCTTRTHLPSLLLVYPDDIGQYIAVEKRISNKLEKARK